MLVESTRTLSVLPHLSKFLRSTVIGTNKLLCTAAAQEKPIMPKKLANATSNASGFKSFRFKYPEFLPSPVLKRRNAVREKLERRDMLRRRKNIFIPEFYVGSVLAVTSSNKHAPNKQTRFVGICIMKEDAGLNTLFLLRNIVGNHGVEVLYSLYSPLIHKIEVLRLEKRLDDNLFYLRDAPNEYSTFSFDMLQEYHDETKTVPINPLKVPLNPRPWHQKYEQLDYKGVILPKIPEKLLEKAEKVVKPWEKYDLMDEYRKITPEEDQIEIYDEICNDLKEIEMMHKTTRKRKEFVKPAKQKLF